MARTPEPLTDEQYTVAYIAALKQKGVLTVPASQALKDRAAWPELSAADAGFKRAELQWDVAIEAAEFLEPPEAQVSDSIPHQRTKAEVDALAARGRIAENGSVIAAKSAEVVRVSAATPLADKIAPSNRVMPLGVTTTVQYAVDGRVFGSQQEALDYAFVTRMEEALGVPLDIDVLKQNAELIFELVRHYIGEERG